MSWKEYEDIYEKTAVFCLRRFLCWYEYEEQPQSLLLMCPSVLNETGLPISADVEKNFCVLSITQESGSTNTMHQ